MKKITVILVSILCLSCVFALDIKPYLTGLDLHPLVLNGFCPTYAGAGIDFKISDNDWHAKVSLSGGVYERGFFQNPSTGEYIIDNGKQVQYTDLTNLELELKGEYKFDEFSTVTFGYWGIFEKRDVWEKNKTVKRWLGGTEQEVLSTDISEWCENLGGNNVYPELGTDSSVYNAIKVEYQYNRMFDNMVANDGYLIKAKVIAAPGFANKQANMVSATVDFIVAENFFDRRYENGNCRLAFSIIDRVNINITKGAVPAYFQEAASMGRRVRGFDTASYTNDTSVVNNLELRLSGPGVTENIFLRTDVFFDFGIGFGNRMNTDDRKTDVLASIGIQEMIDYNDAFDLGLEVAYLVKGSRMSNPTHPLQIGATFYLDF